MAKRFDAIIVGAGQASPALAGRLTAAGQTVAVIERKLVGGTCVNYDPLGYCVQYKMQESCGIAKPETHALTLCIAPI